RRLGHQEPFWLCARAGDRVGVVPDAEDVPVVEPFALDELELAGDAPAVGDEDQAPVRIRRALLVWSAVRHAPTNEPMAIDQRSVEPQRVARVRPADMAAKGALDTVGVVLVAEIVRR